MYKTVKAEIHPDGTVSVKEAIDLKGPCLAMVTIMEPVVDTAVESSFASKVQRLADMAIHGKQIKPFKREDCYDRDIR